MMIEVMLKMLVDKHGFNYVGGAIDSVYLNPYLNKMKAVLNGDFDKYVYMRKKRDGHMHHVTVINPKEFKKIDSSFVDDLIDKKVKISLKSLGRVSGVSDSTYYVIVESADLHNCRKLVNSNDFHPHVTLGFWKGDIHEFPKNESTAI